MAVSVPAPRPQAMARLVPAVAELRRYARALLGSAAVADAAINALLTAARSDPQLRAQLGTEREALFAAFTKVAAGELERARTVGSAGGRSPLPPVSAGEAAAQTRLALLPPFERQALLLTTVAGLSPAAAARVLGQHPDRVAQARTRAIARIEHAAATRVLVIEDEPLIALQLAACAETLGHAVCGIAATGAAAIAAARREQPGLVLADIALADGSSGLHTVAAINRTLGLDIPHVVITAFPERLLGVTEPAPTWLVAKPFRDTDVRAAIAQALFFHAPEYQRRAAPASERGCPAWS